MSIRYSECALIILPRAGPVKGLPSPYPYGDESPLFNSSMAFRRSLSSAA